MTNPNRLEAKVIHRATHQIEHPQRTEQLGHESPFTMCGMRIAFAFRNPGEADSAHVVEKDPTCKMCRQIAEGRSTPAPARRPDLAKVIPLRPPRQEDGSEPGWYMSAFGIPNRLGKPLPPGIGADCARWRKRIAKGMPLYKTKLGRLPPSYAETLRPIDTCWKRVVVEYLALDPATGKAVEAQGLRWERDPDAQIHAPIRVRCPQCNRPTRLSAWWTHECRAAITKTGSALGDFRELTNGALGPQYEEG